jgi:hypothetical protein
MDRWTARRIQGQTDRHSDRQMDRQTDGQIDIQTDGHLNPGWHFPEGHRYFLSDGTVYKLTRGTDTTSFY